MNGNLPTSSSKALSSLPERPEISDIENRRLSRPERIFNHLLWPRHFRISDADETQLERMKLTYNILAAAVSDIEARAMIKEVVIGVTLTTAEVLELIWETKELFGKLSFRNVDFDRAVVRMQLLDLVRRAKAAGDIKNERLAWKQLIDLDRLAVKENESNAPVVPALPNVIFTNKYEDEELAHIESTPIDDEEE